MSQDPIYTLALAVRAKLLDQQAGICVHYGKEALDVIEGAPIVEFRRNDEGGTDVFSSPVGAGQVRDGTTVKKARATVDVAVMARFTGASGKTGAGEHDHRGVIWRAVEQVVIALTTLGMLSTFKTPLVEATGRFMPLADGTTAEVGARYELSFSVRGSVLEVVGLLSPPAVAVVTVKAKRGEGLPEEVNCGPEPTP